MIKLFQIKWYRWIWELPQILLGLILAGFYKLSHPDHFRIESYEDSYVIHSKGMKGGISLGCYIILGFYDQNLTTVKHEYGHCRQSKMLGPFYLLVIGLPSLIHLLIRREMRHKCDYYHFYTEAWADKLGGVTRT